MSDEGIGEPLPDEMLSAIAQALNERGVDITRDCPECRKGQWEIERFMMGPLVYRIGSAPEQRGFTIEAGAVSVVLTCGNCGYWRPFNAKKIGLDLEGLGTTVEPRHLI